MFSSRTGGAGANGVRRTPRLARFRLRCDKTAKTALGCFDCLNGLSHTSAPLPAWLAWLRTENARPNFIGRRKKLGHEGRKKPAAGRRRLSSLLTHSSSRLAERLAERDTPPPQKRVSIDRPPIDGAEMGVDPKSDALPPRRCPNAPSRGHQIGAANGRRLRARGRQSLLANRRRRAKIKSLNV